MRRAAMRWIRTLAAAVLACGPLAAAQAQACSESHILEFIDGRRGCLTDYPLLHQVPAGQNRVLEALLPGTSRYTLAFAPAGCPAVFAFAGTADPARSLPARVGEQLMAKARADCAAALQTSGAPASCTCEVVVNQGLALLRKSDFDARFASPADTSVEAGVSATAAAELQSAEKELEALQQRLSQLQSGELASAATPARAQPAAPPAPRFSARALVIGNSQYEAFGRLANPANDARAVADRLRSYGIPADLVLDATRDDIIRALNDHARQAEGLDVSILFYAGHGIQVDGVNYVVPANMRADALSPGYVKLAGLALDTVLEYLPARTRLVFLDACRDNPLARQLVGGRSAVSAGLAPVQAASGTLLSYATRDGAIAADGTGRHSPYTQALLQHLDLPLDISLVLRQVRQTVLTLTGGRQEPWEYGSLLGKQIVLSRMARQDER